MLSAQLSHLVLKTSTIFVCLFELMFNVPVNSYGHVGTLPLFYGTFSQNEDVMTSNKYFKYNHLQSISVHSDDPKYFDFPIMFFDWTVYLIQSQCSIINLPYN